MLFGRVRACSKIHALREFSILQISTEKGLLSFHVRIFKGIDLNRSALSVEDRLAFVKKDGFFRMIPQQLSTCSGNAPKFCTLYSRNDFGVAAFNGGCSGNMNVVNKLCVAFMICMGFRAVAFAM